MRNAVWDHLHGRPPSPPTGDVDVIWYDPRQTDRLQDEAIERALGAVEPHVRWSVKNQARMHGRNGDDPYGSVLEAIRHWPETATAVAVRRQENGQCEVAAPWGLDDLLSLTLRPTPRFRDEKRDVYEDRLRTKGWLTTWPQLRRAA